MIILHHLNNSRSQRILWLLEELALEYEIKHYQRDSETMLAPQSLKDIHPLGKSPVISDGDTVIAESAAIIDYLVRNFGQKTLIPDEDTAEFIQHTYWMHFAEGSLMSPLILRLVFERIKTGPMPFFVKPIARAIANKVMTAFISPNIKNNFDYIENYLEDKQWFAGDSISGADIQMSFPLEASVARGLIDENYPNITQYVAKFQARDAYQKALQTGGDYDYA